MNKPPSNAINCYGHSLGQSYDCLAEANGFYDKWKHHVKDTRTCPNKNPAFRLVRSSDGKVIVPNCNLYSCPVCGPIKVRKLEQALVKYFEQFDHMRILTLTMTSENAFSESSHYQNLSKAFRYFMTELRRSKLLTKRQNKVQYVKLLDIHTGKHSPEHEGQNLGFIHYHILISEWIKWKDVQNIWERCCQEVLGSTKHCGSANIKGFLNARHAAHYAAKYVAKTARYMEQKVRRYSKSSRVALFAKKVMKDCWYFINIHKDELQQIDSQNLKYNLTCIPDVITSQEYTSSNSS